MIIPQLQVKYETFNRKRTEILNQGIFWEGCQANERWKWNERNRFLRTLSHTFMQSYPIIRSWLLLSASSKNGISFWVPVINARKKQILKPFRNACESPKMKWWELTLICLVNGRNSINGSHNNCSVTRNMPFQFWTLSLFRKKNLYFVWNSEYRMCFVSGKGICKWKRGSFLWTFHAYQICKRKIVKW